jgi:hypothetical protein
MDDPVRRALIREAMTCGTLPKVSAMPRQIYAGRGSGAPCSGCGKLIPTTVNEYEIDVGAVRIRLHLRGFAAWAEEIEKRGS